MTEAQLSRANALLQQRRADQALEILTDILGKEPYNIEALQLLIRSYLDLRKLDGADSAANDLLQTAPDSSYSHYLKGIISLEKDDVESAEHHLSKAVEIDPELAEYRAVLGHVLFKERKWEQALAMANSGLALDASNLSCLNLRSNCLVKLGRNEEAEETMDKALDRDAENAWTHASTGWNLLEAGDHVKALDHFTTALKLDPSLEHAKQGMIEALKAKNKIYRLFLKYKFWMTNLGQQNQWLIILGAYFAIRYVGRMADKHPELTNYLVPLIAIYTLFALSTWVIAPLSTLFLRADKQGRHALNEKEMRVGTYTLFFVSLMGLGLVGGLAGLLGEFDAEETIKKTSLALFFFGFLMLIPVSGLLKATDSNRTIMRILAIVLFVLGAYALMAVANGAPLLSASTTPFVYALIGYQFGANFFLSR